MLSLIIATRGRNIEIESLFISLKNQTYQSFEVILVDQNNDNRLDSIVAGYNDSLLIKHIKSSSVGLSLNRNIGIQYANGRIICFPDDDCSFLDSSFFSEIMEKFASHPYLDFISTNTKDYTTGGSILKTPNYAKFIDNLNVFQCCISFTLFIKIKNRSHIFFDEQLGVGARFGSAEESDLVYSLLSLGYKGRFIHDIYVHHPEKKDSLSFNKGYNYGLGLGALYKKNIFYRKAYFQIPFLLNVLLRPLGAALILKRPSFNIGTFIGRITGFISYKK